MVDRKEKYSIKLKSIGKKYLLYHRRKPTLISNIFNLENSEEFWALKGVNLKIKKGDKVGIVGKNGSGKTTLLKIITGISDPTVGKVSTVGKVVSLLDPNAGFHPDLTGYENIKINGLLLGMSKEEIDRNTEKIIKFADIGNFISAPFYTYSTGMRLRLGFSISIYADADILIFDETIFAGDQGCIRKIYLKLMELFSEKNVSLLVTTHIPELLKDYCNKCLWLDKGRVVEYGSFKRIVKKYKSKI